MKKPQLLILVLLVALIAVFMYTDNPYYYQNNISKKVRGCKRQLGCWQGTLNNWQEMIQDKLPF